MSRKHQFIGSLINIIKHNRDGSFRTQNDRRESLMYIVKSLYKDGYQLEHVKYIKRRHIEHLVKKWLNEEISIGSIKNRMSHLRWLTEKLSTSYIIPSNDELKIPKRIYISQKDKSRELNEEHLEKISNRYMQLSLQGQKLFGLRQEESLKLKPFIADQGDKLYLRGSWTKGGRERWIPILTSEQREWLNACKELVKYKDNSLIPAETTYARYRECFKRSCINAGLTKRHGLRHQYAQNRYRELTGFVCPVKGGLTKRQMTNEQKMLDKQSRLTLSKELGHNRTAIVKIYIGR